MRARRALMLFKDILLRTRRGLLLYKVYCDSTLLDLKGTLFYSINALLAHKPIKFILIWDVPNFVSLLVFLYLKLFEVLILLTVPVTNPHPTQKKRKKRKEKGEPLIVVSEPLCSSKLQPPTTNPYYITAQVIYLSGHEAYYFQTHAFIYQWCSIDWWDWYADKFSLCTLLPDYYFLSMCLICYVPQLIALIIHSFKESFIFFE